MSEATCKVNVPDGGRSVLFHTCGRKLSGSDDYPELCGLHAAAKRRALAKDQMNRVEADKARDEVQNADAHALRLTAALGVTVTAETKFDNKIRRWPTRFARVRQGDLQKLADRIAELESELARWHRIDGQAAL